MWPYLHARGAEAMSRRQAFDACFLDVYFKANGLPNPIARRLWASPDDERQITIALRYVIQVPCHVEVFCHAQMNIMQVCGYASVVCVIARIRRWGT